MSSPVASIPAAPATGAAVEPAAARTRAEPLVLRVGFWGLLLLALALPFEATQRPLLQTRALTLTNLKILIYLVVALALAGMARLAWRDGAGLLRYLRSRRVALALLGGLAAVCIASSLQATHRAEGLKWTLDLLLGGALWLAVPLWLATGTERKLYRLAAALTAGATLSALLGVLEIVYGYRFADSLLLFKAKPATAGSYLRLSGTFDTANSAAMFYELILPFAVYGLAATLAGPGRRRLALGWSAALVVLLGAIGLTYSRGGFLGLAAAAVVMSVAARGRLGSLRRHWRWPLGIAVCLVVPLAFVSPTLALVRLTTESDQGWYVAAYHGSLPPTIHAGRPFLASVQVTNHSAFTWNRDGANPYHLSYHWLAVAGRDRAGHILPGKVVVFEGLRTALPASLPVGHSARVGAIVLPPGRPGHYLLVWDMVQERVVWFSLKSGAYHAVAVTVHGPARRISAVNDGPAYLPNLPSIPDRSRLWHVALRMIRARPLLGVGPDGYRLNYGRYTVPPQTTWDTRLPAHSLPLEILADLGVLGGVLYFGFLAVVAWPVAREVYPGHVSTLWRLALIGAGAAFLAHGLVDYILGSHAVFTLFWLFCGLAGLSTLPAGMVASCSSGSTSPAR